MPAEVGASLYPSAEELVEAARASIPGPDVFAVAPDNVLSYCCGTWKLVEHDIAAVLPAELARTVLDFLRSLGVCEAFRIREELVNYKKVLLHVHQRGLDVERRLSQLASFFHEERERCEGGFSRPSARRGEITDARMECKGRCEATYDARLVGKALCNLPRHPAKGRPSALQELPCSLRCWRIAEAALAACPSEAAMEPVKPTPCDSVVDTDGVHGGSWHQAAEQSLASQGWPEHLCGFVRAVMICRGADKALRVRDELLLARKELEGCKSSWFCPHAQCCFKCEAHSCDDCRLSRGDGEQVAQLAAQLRPARVALDFDRTLATTRSGGTPLVGKDSLDADLLPVLWEHQAACMIVTRNSHVDEINAFLAANGAPDKLPIHSLKRPRSKAEFIIPGLGDDEIAIFVDDTIAELVDPLVANDQRVHRVLFVRGLL